MQNLQEITVYKDDVTLANDDTRDAFTAVEPITVTGAQSKIVTLTRPFAQINFGAPWADVEDAEAIIQAAE